MKYGSRLVLLTCSHADMIDLVSGRGPQENTPILDTWGKADKISLTVKKLCQKPKILSIEA